MAENPLLPHRKLKELHALILRCRDLQRKLRGKDSAAREALLAATSIHLEPGDLLFPEPDDLVAALLMPASKAKTLPPQTPPPASLSRLAVASAAAKGLQAAQTEGIALAFATAGTVESGWMAALEYAQRNQLPFLLAVADATSPSSRASTAKEPPLTYEAIYSFAKRLKLPVLPVDGEDAVALYRVMQESALHARIGGGPAVIWAHLSSPKVKLSPAQQPLGRLKSYLKVRGINI